MIITTDVSHDYAEMSVTDKVAFGYHVVGEMTINITTYPTPDDPLTNVTTASSNLKNGNDAYLGNPALHDALLDLERVWVKVVNKQAKYVSRIADHVAATIDLSGFHHTKTTSDPTALPSVAVLKDHYPVAKGKYYAHAAPQVHNNFVFIICPLDAVVTQNGGQISVDKPFSFISDTHPVGDFINLPSGDQHLVIGVFNRTGMCILTAPIVISVP
jgi:hypothetical protein